MKSAWWTAAVLVMLVMETGRRPLLAQAQEGAKDDRAEISLKGEIVDLHCYTTRGARGAEHAGCANACLARGVAAGLLAEDGRLFLLLGERPFPVKEQVAGLAGQAVTVKGTLVERDGIRALRLGSVSRQ
jgi:hypothetical protein